MGAEDCCLSMVGGAEGAISRGLDQALQAGVAVKGSDLAFDEFIAHDSFISTCVSASSPRLISNFWEP